MGGLDGHVGAAPLLWQAIVVTLRDIPDGPPRTTADLTNVAGALFTDSTGLTLATQTRVIPNGAKCMLLQCSSRMRRLLERLDERLKLRSK
jgi:hypothetical protein